MTRLGNCRSPQRVKVSGQSFLKLEAHRPSSQTRSDALADDCMSNIMLLIERATDIRYSNLSKLSSNSSFRMPTWAWSIACPI
jgi:hypothetical protein